jgi:hypothetical protein
MLTAIYQAVASTMVTPPRKHIMDGDGNIWVSPTTPSSDGEGPDSPANKELPTFESVGADEPRDTDDVQDDGLVSLETNMPIEIHNHSCSDDGRLPSHNDTSSGHDMISPGQRVDAPGGNTSMATLGRDIDMEQPEDPGMSDIITLLCRV